LPGLPSWRRPLP